MLQSSLQFDNKQYYIFGDGAYTLQPWLQRPSLGILDDEKAAFNSQMSSVRVSVEHNYKDLKVPNFVFPENTIAARTIITPPPRACLEKRLAEDLFRAQNRAWPSESLRQKLFSLEMLPSIQNGSERNTLRPNLLCQYMASFES